MGGHQSDRLDQARVQFRFAPGLLQKDLAIEGPMFGADVGKPDIGIEMAARDIAQPHRDIGKLGKRFRLVGIRDEAGRIDDDLPPLEFRMQKVGKHFRRGRSPVLRGQDADAYRTAKLAPNIHPECKVVGQVIVTIGNALGFRWQDRALTEIGTVAQTINLVLVLRRFGETVVYMFEGIGGAFRDKSDGFGRRPHMLLLTTSQQLPRVTTSQQLLRAGKTVNSLLTPMQRDRGDRVNTTNCRYFPERFQAKRKPVRVKKTRQIKRGPFRFYRNGSGSRRSIATAIRATSRPAGGGR